MATDHPVPEGFHTVTAHLVVDGASDAIEFYQRAFDAREITRMAGPRGKLMYAEIRIGNSRVMLSDALPEMGSEGPPRDGGTPVTLHLYVDDCDTTFARAVAAGAEVVMPLEDMFWGDRYGKIKDPFGHQWAIATHREDLSEEEIQMRAPTMEA